MNEFLNGLRKKLANQGYETYEVPLNEERTSQQIVLVLDKDSDLNLSIFFLSDLLNLSTTHQGVAEITQEFKESKVDFLQLYIRFPFDLLPEATPDLARLILMANWSTPIGAFGLNESQKIIYYRHVFENIGNDPSEEVVIEAISAMAYFARMRYDSLKTIASLEKSLSGYLEELEMRNEKSEEFPGYDL